jgi:hypothetical protein
MKSLPRKDIKEQMLRLADITQMFIAQGDLKRAMQYMEKVGEMLKTEDKGIRDAVDLYLSSVSQFIESNKQRVSDLLPESLMPAYEQQVRESAA